jgi:fatty-acyl-CoA synthase
MTALPLSHALPRVLHDQQAVQHKFWPRRLPRQLDVPQTSLWFNLEVSAARFPNKTATIFCGEAISYAELHRQAEALAGWLQAVGVKAGDRVALFMQNCPQYLIAFYAVNRANAVVVPVNPMNRAEEFGHYLNDPDTQVVICSADLAAVVAAAAALCWWHAMRTRFQRVLHLPLNWQPSWACRRFC